MNPNLSRLQPYPFEKLRTLFGGVPPNPAFAPVSMQIGEPKHPTPGFVRQALTDNLSGLALYPATAGTPALREAIADWLTRRYDLPAIDPVTHVLPVNGSREALFAIAQVVVDGTRPGALVVCPNPFYQIYEGAALLAGASAYFVNAVAPMEYSTDHVSVPAEVWARTQLVYACSPGNPTGRVMTLDEWKVLFDLADRYEFVIAADECYSELYPEESRPPLGALEASERLGRKNFARLIVFSSLSKRSNAPGMRSGFVAGDPDLLKAFLLYRTYHGSAMNPAIQAASAAAWRDEEHVRANRKLYAEKYRAVFPLFRTPLKTALPDGGFYLWISTPGDDARFARDLYAAYNVAVLPGSFLAREAHGINPGKDHIRIALVASIDECVEGCRRIAEFASQLN